MSPQEGKQSALGPDALSRKMFLRTAHGAGRGAGRRAAAHALIRPLTSTPPNLSWLSIRREQVALVSKAKDADDDRVVVLALTEPGWKALERATPPMLDAERALLANFTQARAASRQT